MGISLRPEHLKRYRDIGLLMAALILGAAMLMQVPTAFRIYGYPGLAIIFFVLAAIGAIGLMLQILRDDKQA